ncbi:MAG TPA: endonuclease V [Leptospiraceae bacterium]|nr:endonuclease V [Leptospiraceae bacterium]HMW07088.1 endonuclease V [Leptospiraceae bacterium]HMX32262.1 endonuclease V [Leptospiraceae bacterium]HMY32595.1 endonuclease V [Leptospiraceae bacterium]HMZ63871.1 endonuclease V [Leptospiraceae bacterium]
MKPITIAVFDVYYFEAYANGCCVVFKKEKEEKVLSEYSKKIEETSEYIPGEFYKRELPCILRTFDLIEEEIDIIILDSFVWLEEGKKGLGGYLYEALEKKIPVIGVAKTYFRSVSSYKELYRGVSKKPLYISSIGIDLNYAFDLIQSLEGEYRIPNVLKRVDQLSRQI